MLWGVIFHLRSLMNTYWECFIGLVPGLNWESWLGPFWNHEESDCSPVLSVTVLVVGLFLHIAKLFVLDNCTSFRKKWLTVISNHLNIVCGQKACLSRTSHSCFYFLIISCELLQSDYWTLNYRNILLMDFHVLGNQMAFEMSDHQMAIWAMA